MPLLIYDDRTVDGAKVDEALLRRAFEAFADDIGLGDCVEAELEIDDAHAIRELNREARGVDAVTDVLSFPSIELKLPFHAEDYAEDSDPESGRIMFGEIMLCAERAAEQAEEYGHSFERECAYLLVHGLLHLAGYDHENENQKAAMRRKEEEILQKIGAPRDV